ncbi:Uncharacterized conserved protein, DUF362 family [Geoalkalibacter ferrihydriticus]|uniref:Uncharacterized conserved protein, DUF362 family n=1 Tax=Geoalkalibacter ferrihydriticus TaxID=392333 RepID=A0A1G9M6A9_9BACT|nr:DUF362 domain-containing protein [Geoalkalibacter ferrihydriticus]SDL69225.1 Uncharacterized conserved protein, DUF362 family [Geoalkalibacter ferrihydriticus]
MQTNRAETFGRFDPGRNNPPLKRGEVFVHSLSSWTASVSHLLSAAGLAQQLAGHRTVLLKPNLVEASVPPVTTPVDLTAAVVDFIQAQAPGIRIIIGEGCGSLEYDTPHCFATLGYTELAADRKIELLDLNHAPLIEISHPQCRRWPSMHLPSVLFESFLISLPVLKAHTLAGVTLSMKNMMGAAPPRHYQQGGHWKKAAFHTGIHDAICDLNRYRRPDFTLLDASVGMQKAHLWGPTCDPAPNLLVCGYDPVAVDAYGCGILGLDWRDIGHLAEAHGELGQADPLLPHEI